MKYSSSNLNNVLAIFLLCLLPTSYVVLAHNKHHKANHKRHHDIQVDQSPEHDEQHIEPVTHDEPQNTPQATASGSGSTPQHWLDAHNEARAEVGVPPLTWNQSLVDYAQKYADSRYEKCEFEHSMGPYGENLAMNYENMEGTNAVKFWCTEKADYDHATNTCKTGEWECGHYTQVVARKTISVGCARSKCKNGWMFVICSYYPVGNIDGEKPY